MKNMTKIVVAISLILAASLLVAPAAADRWYEAGQFHIRDGDTIFVWEENLNLATFLGDVNRLRKFVDDDPMKALVHEIPVRDAANFDVIFADVQRHYGVYYTDFGDEVVIREPSLATDVKLSGTVDSVDGKTIGDNEEIYFRTHAPYVGAFYANTQLNQYAQITVEFTTPGGAKLTTFGGVNLRGVDLTSTQFDTVNIPLADEPAGTYTAVVKWAAPGGFADFAASSGSVSFTVETRLIEITSNVDSLVRNNNFVVTISGESAYDYRLFVKNPQAVVEENPRITDGQPGVTITDATRLEANVRTRADGTRPIEFRTTSDTEAKTFTIRVEDWADPDEYDEVKVRVEAGAITIEASGDRTYYIGEEVTFSGTNTDSDTTYFFITGPNLPREGGQLLTPMVAVNEAAPGTFRPTPVRTDDTYERKWSTSGIGLDAGSYTVYALTDPFNRNNLAQANDYDSVSIVLRKPFVTATPSATTVAKGDDIYIRGTAEGEPSDGVAVWVFGRNYFFRGTVDVEDDGTFEFDDLDSAWTADRSAGQYFVVVQHPMENDEFDVVVRTVGDRTLVQDRDGIDEFVVEGPGRLQGAQAAQALIDLLNKPQIDDTYVRASFLVEEPWIRIDSIGDRYVGDTFTITGTTNLAVDNDLIVEVISSRFEPAPKEAPAEFAGASGTVKVVDGNADYNSWSFEVDATPFAPDEYIVSVESIEAAITSTTTLMDFAGSCTIFAKYSLAIHTLAC